MRRRRIRALAGGVVLLALGVGVIAVRGTSADSFVRTVVLQGQPGAMVIDARTGRAFIVSTNAAGDNGYVGVLDTASGALLRSVPVGNRPGDIVVDAQTNRVFVSDPQDEALLVLDARSGALLRRVAVGYMPGGLGGLVDTHTGRIFGWASGVQMLDARSGTTLRTIPNIGGDGNGQIALDERTGRVFVADDGANRVHLLDARSGAILRTIALGWRPFRVMASAATGRVFVIGGTATLMLDARTGRVLRVISAGMSVGPFDYVSATMAAGAGAHALLMIGPNAGLLTLVDARTGRVIRTITVGPEGGQPILDGQTGNIFVAGTASAQSDDGRVWMIDARSGAVRRTITVAPNPSGIALDERSDHIIVASVGGVAQYRPIGVGSVSILDARLGAVLRVAPVGVDPWLVTVDEKTGHVFILNGGGTVPVSEPWAWIPLWLRRRLPFLQSPGPYVRTAPSSVSVLDAT